MNVPAPPAIDKPGPGLWLLEETSEDRNRRYRSAALSVGVNVLMGLLAIWIIRVAPAPHRPADWTRIDYLIQNATPLIAPPARMTQPDPNQGPLTKEFNAESIRPRLSRESLPRPGAAELPKRQAQKFTPPPAQPRGPAPSQTLIEAPSIDIGRVRPAQTLPPGLGVDAPPPPQIQPQEQPKLALETPGTASGRVNQPGRVPAAPRASIDEAIRSVARGAGRGGIVVGDEDAGILSSPQARSSTMPGKLGSSLELLSDPQGVDFRPYLIRVLTAVRRNWHAVMPESARLGRAGRVAIQFAISKDGAVPKLVIAVPSGAEALDRAAVAGISASNPFPPLPPDFKGGQIRLQLSFKYNLP